jgi:fructose-1,6-bisphosphatase/inositol monophosphatase family enzyme
MTQHLERRFIEAFRLAALQAGAVALHLQGKVRAETKRGDSAEAEALTAVDLAAQDVILHLLHRELPKVALDAEEQTETLRLFAPADGADHLPLMVVDPVDGTLNYLRGSADYAVMGGLMQDGRFTAGLIHFPVAGSTYWAIRGGGCFVDAPGGPQRRTAGGAEPLIFFDPRTPERWRGALSDVGATQLCRCSAVDASAPATGRGRAGVATGGADRRRAIGLFLSLEAGAVVRIGGRSWHGEDPARIAQAEVPSIVAEDDALAARLAQCLDAAAGC